MTTEHDGEPTPAGTAARRRNVSISPPYRVPDLRSSQLRAPAHEPLAIPPTPSEDTGPGPALAGRWELIHRSGPCCGSVAGVRNDLTISLKVLRMVLRQS